MSRLLASRLPGNCHELANATAVGTSSPHINNGISCRPVRDEIRSCAGSEKADAPAIRIEHRRMRDTDRSASSQVRVYQPRLPFGFPPISIDKQLLPRCVSNAHSDVLIVGTQRAGVCRNNFSNAVADTVVQQAAQDRRSWSEYSRSHTRHWCSPPLRTIDTTCLPEWRRHSERTQSRYATVHIPKVNLRFDTASSERAQPILLQGSRKALAV